MAASQKGRPTVEELRRLVDKNGVEATAKMLGVGKSTVYNRINRRVRASQAPDMWFAPWIVQPVHASCETGRMLKLMHRVESSGILKLGGGRHVDPVVTGLVTDWKLRIEYNDYVIVYHADTQPHLLEPKGGFYYRPRLPTDSPGIMQLHQDCEPPPTAEQLAEWGRSFS